MNSNSFKTRALGLCSGGLDSILSALVLKKQGIHVEWITFETPFFSSEKAKTASEKYRISLIVENITPVYLKMLKNPKCGYGKHMNPCLDCHALMFRMAGEFLKNMGFDFVFSGEVLGQRPMSQTKQSLRYVEKNSGLEGYILRPLSALNLSSTIPEEKGLVARNQLLDFKGRSRKHQIELADQLNVTGYPAPAGGCLLTDRGYSRRLKDLFDHQETYMENELHLLKFGRHFRIDKQTKIIVGRTKTDNENILKHIDSEKDFLINVKNFPGPVVIISSSCSHDNLILAASICAGYSKAPNDEPVFVTVENAKSKHTLTVTAIQPETVKVHLLS
ncbi:MAG: tRNA 4-thiouridine(8) synthase ThiI [Deltaproteobacteria bacterium]|nr:tRNA 4-thiouridine(8) synthase ThiI [Deltaproteobacteria bacterium]